MLHSVCKNGVPETSTVKGREFTRNRLIETPKKRVKKFKKEKSTEESSL